MGEILANGEPLNVALVLPWKEASRFRDLCPGPVWIHFDSLEQFQCSAEKDQVDVLVLDDSRLLAGWSARGQYWAERAEGHPPLRSLAQRHAILVLTAPGCSPLPWMRLEGVTVFRKPVDSDLVAAYLSAQQEAVVTRKVRRLFHEVAAAFAGGIKR